MALYEPVPLKQPWSTINTPENFTQFMLAPLTLTEIKNCSNRRPWSFISESVSASRCSRRRDCAEYPVSSERRLQSLEIRSSLGKILTTCTPLKKGIKFLSSTLSSLNICSRTFAAYEPRNLRQVAQTPNSATLEWEVDDAADDDLVFIVAVRYTPEYNHQVATEETGIVVEDLLPYAKTRVLVKACQPESLGFCSNEVEFQVQAAVDGKCLDYAS